MTEGTAYDVVDYPSLIHVAMHPSKLGAIGRPAHVFFVNLLPKTRSGKVLRRSLQALAEGRGKAQAQGAGDIIGPEQGVGHEAVIRGIAHRRVQDTVNEQRARFLVEFILHRFAAGGHFDDHVEALGRIVAHGDFVDLHGAGL